MKLFALGAYPCSWAADLEQTVLPVVIPRGSMVDVVCQPTDLRHPVWHCPSGHPWDRVHHPPAAVASGLLTVPAVLAVCWRHVADDGVEYVAAAEPPDGRLRCRAAHALA